MLQSGEALCLTQDAFHKVLHAGGCGDFSGAWRLRRGRKVFMAKAAASLQTGGRLGFRPVERVREKLAMEMKDSDRLGIFRKLILNQGDGTARASLFRDLGFVHVFTASGLHLYALAFWIYALAFAVGKVLSRQVDLEKWVRISAAGISVSLCVWLWLLSGLRPGFLRPWILVGLRAGAKRLGWRWTRFAPLGLALGVDGAWAILNWMKGDPEPFAPGRWHYALAVGGGLLAMETVAQAPAWRKHLALSLGSWLTTAVWDAATRGLVSAATPVISLLTIPWISLFALPISVFPFPSSVQVAGRNLTTVAFEALGEWAAYGTVLTVSRPGVIWALILALGIAFFPRRYRIASSVAVVAVLAGLSLKRPAPDWSRVDVIQLNVKQGDAALIQDRTGSYSGLIDTGSRHWVSLASWLERLAFFHVGRLEFLALTHFDEDHAGNAEALRMLVPTKSESPPLPHLTLGPVCGRSGQAPNAVMTGYVLPLNGGGAYVNLGDADAAKEKAFVAWVGREVNGAGGLRIWKASHHGSRTSSGQELLSFISRRPWLEGGRPEVWISVGAGNSYGHPSAEVLSGFTSAGFVVRRTDLEGDLQWEAVRPAASSSESVMRTKSSNFPGRAAE